MLDEGQMKLHNRYGMFTIEGIDAEWIHPVYTVLVLNRPIVEMINIISEDHQVMYRHSTRRNPNMSTRLCGGYICLDFRLVYLDHLSSEPDPAEHAYREKFYQAFWDQNGPVLERSAFAGYRQPEV